MSHKESNKPKIGKLFVVAGPSGVGKNTIIGKILKYDELNVILSISCTTREKRGNEVDKKDYFFVTKKEFKQLIKDDELIEYAEFFDNFYGTPKKFLFDTLSSGQNLLLEIEVIGFNQVISKFPDLISIFLLPPTLDQLQTRLINRNSENEKDIHMRMQKAKLELEEANNFDYQIVNNDVEATTEQIRQIILDEIAK